MISCFLPWLKSCRVRQTRAFFVAVVWGMVLSVAPHLTAAVVVTARAGGDVEIHGTVVPPPAAPFPAYLFNHTDDKPDGTIPTDAYLKILDVRDSLGTLDVQHVYAGARLESHSSGELVHTVDTLAVVRSSPDPIYDVFYAQANLAVERTMAVDREYRFAFTWNRFKGTELDRPFETVDFLDGSHFSVPGLTSGAPVDDAFNIHSSGLISPGESVTMTSNLRLTGDARLFEDGYPPFFLSVGDTMTLRLLPVDAGLTQETALLPETVVPGSEWLFSNYPSGLWFDPPTTSELSFEMTSETLFNQILDFPTGLDMPVTVESEGQVLGAFGPGDALDFVALLGHGVSSFKVSGISPPATTSDTPGFSLQIAFNEPTADFQIRAFEVVPEPSSLALCCLAAFLVATQGLSRAAGRRC